MKTIAVIGPDADEAARVAGTLTSVRALPGAGPKDGIDGVIAVADSPDIDNVQVVTAIVESMGTIVVVTDARWPDIPGAHFCSRQDVATLQSLTNRLWVDEHDWATEARRGDHNRLEQAKVAIRLHTQRAGQDVLQRTADAAEPVDGSRNAEVLRSAHEQFLAQLRVAVLAQGIVCPHVPDSPPEPATPVELPGRVAQLAALIAGVIGIVGLFFAVGRVAGLPWLGLCLGIVAAGAVAWFRGITLRRQHARAQFHADLQALQTAWSARVTEVLSRLSAPRVAEQLAIPAGER